jgi:hypothetical protein
MRTIILAALAVSACFGNTVYFQSSTANTNNSGSSTIAATVDSSWATALTSPSPTPSIWITDSGNPEPALGTSVTFTQNITLGSFTSAILDLGVYADDSATVVLDGTTLFTEDTTLGTHCAAGPIGCVSGTEGIESNLNVSSIVHSGVNTLTIQDFQEVGYTPFGVDFDGSITTSTAATPEPTSAFLLSGCVLGAAWLRRRAAKRA